MSASDIVLLILLGTAAFLDQWPAIQTMASRPLVTGSLAGLVLGAPHEGALWGAVFEAVYLGVLPIGASRYPDAGLAGLVGTVVALGGGSAAADPTPPAGLAVAAGGVAGLLGEWTGHFQRRWNGRTAERVREGVASGDPSALGRGIAVALARAAALGAAATAAALAIGLVGLALLGSTPWSGPLPMGWVRLAGVAMAGVAGLRLFARADHARATIGAGLGCGAVLAWLAGSG